MDGRKRGRMRGVFGPVHLFIPPPPLVGGALGLGVMGTSWAEVARVAVGLTAPREEVDDELPAWVDAIEARDVERVRGLSFDVNTVWIDDRGRPLTPLGLAVLWLHAPMVELLLDRGAHPDGTFRDGWTPLGLAMHLHSSDGAFHVDGHPWPPVLSAVQEATMRIARLLVERGASSKAVCVANFRRLGSLVESLRAVGPSVPTSTHREARRSIHAHLRRRRWRDLQWIALLLFRCWLAGLALGATGVVRWFSMLIDRDVGEGVLWGAVWGGCGPFAAAASMGAVPLVLPVLPVAGPFYFDLDLFVRAVRVGGRECGSSCALRSGRFSPPYTASSLAPLSSLQSPARSLTIANASGICVALWNWPSTIAPCLSPSSWTTARVWSTCAPSINGA